MNLILIYQCSLLFSVQSFKECFHLAQQLSRPVQKYCVHYQMKPWFVGNLWRWNAMWREIHVQWSSGERTVVSLATQKTFDKHTKMSQLSYKSTMFTKKTRVATNVWLVMLMVPFPLNVQLSWRVHIFFCINSQNTMY